VTGRALYLVNGSISSIRVLVALHEKALPFEPRRLRVMREPRDTRTPAFLALNPRGQAPVLVEPDGVVMNESLAILTFLELRYPTPPLLPRDRPADLARALAYAQEAETTAQIYEPLEALFDDAAARTPEARPAITGALAGLDHELALWEARAAVPFIAGETFSIADCAFYPVLTYMRRRGLALDRHPALDAYHARIAARPSAIASHPEGWEQGRVGRVNLFARAAALSQGR